MCGCQCFLAKTIAVLHCTVYCNAHGKLDRMYSTVLYCNALKSTYSAAKDLSHLFDETRILLCYVYMCWGGKVLYSTEIYCTVHQASHLPHICF